MKNHSLILIALIVAIVCDSLKSLTALNYRPQQNLNTFSIYTTLNTVDNSSLKSNCIYNCAYVTLFQKSTQRSLSEIILPIMSIFNIVLQPNNVVKFVIYNPPIDIKNAIIIININNINIVQKAIKSPIAELYSTNTMTSITNSSFSLISQILISILLFIVYIFYLLGYKNNHTINFIQKISFLRFNLVFNPSIFSFLFSLKYSYYAYGWNALQSVLPAPYIENSNGNFYLFDRDANILRNVGIPIIFSIAALFFRLVGLVAFRKLSSEQSEIQATIKKSYYRTIEYFQRTIMFPIMFFSIANITFAKFYGIAITTNSISYYISVSFSIIYLIYFAMLITATFFFSPQICKYTKLDLLGEYIFSLVDSVIIVLTYYSQNFLILIITIVVKIVYQLFIKYLFQGISKLDILKIIVMSLQVSLIILFKNQDISLTSIQILFIIIIVIDLIYMSLATISKRREKREIKNTHKDEHEITLSAIKDKELDRNNRVSKIEDHSIL